MKCKKICLKLEHQANHTPGTKDREAPQIYTLLDLGQFACAKQRSTLKKPRHSGVRDQYIVTFYKINYTGIHQLLENFTEDRK